VEVQNIELIDPPANVVQHDHVVGQTVPHGTVETHCHLATAH
jgi:hypothetical protein